MMSVSVESKIRDWANGLGFRLPDGSTPPENYFNSLLETPRRRHLWEEIVESVLPRQKVKHLRKQILVSKIQHKKKFSKKNYSVLVIDRIDLWDKLNDLLPELKDKRNEVIKLEADTLTKSSDLIFEICKLAGLEKKFDEMSDEILILKLFSKKKKKMFEELECKLLKLEKVSNDEGKFEDFEGKRNFIINHSINPEEFKCLPVEMLPVECHSCNKTELLCISETLEPYLWGKFIKCKQNLLQYFFEFLTQLNSNEKNNMSEKATEIEKNLNKLVEQLKQKITVKSLEIMISSTKGKLLESEIEELKGLTAKKLRDGNNVENYSSSNKMNEYYKGSEEQNYYKHFNSYVGVMGQKSYREFLKEELNRLEEEELKTRKKNYSRKDEKEAFESIAGEIHSRQLEIKEVENEILLCLDKFENFLRSSKKKVAEMKESKAAEEAAEKLKSASEKQINVFLGIPLDAFRTFKCSSGRIILECESESNCLENYGGEFKQLFSAVLIPPLNELSKVISEVSERKQIINEVKNFISGKDKLASVERKVQGLVNSVKYDLQLCEKNFKESDGILWNTFSKTDQLFREIDFAEKILKNLLEQPYRLMITEPIQEESYKNFEEQCGKEKSN